MKNRFLAQYVWNFYMIFVFRIHSNGRAFVTGVVVSPKPYENPSKWKQFMENSKFLISVLSCEQDCLPEFWKIIYK